MRHSKRTICRWAFLPAPLAAIVSLFGTSSPTTIARLIIAIIIYTIKRHSRRTFAHIAPDDPEWNLYRGCMAEIDTTRPEEAAFTIKMLLADQETRFRIGQLGFEAFSAHPQKDYLPL